MDVVVKPTKDAEVEVTVTASADELSPFVREAAKKLSEDTPLKGFRPGKAPADVVAETVGEESLMHEALNKAVPQLFVKAVLEEEIEAIDQPKVVVNSLSRTEGLTFTATVMTLPEVALGDLSTITISKRPASVSDEDIDHELQHLAKTRSTFIDVARPAQQGDTVKVDFTIMVNGTVLEGGEGKDQTVTLGEGFFVKDFEDKLQGIAAGDSREFEINFPDDYGKKELAGKKAQAKVAAKAVQKRMLPTIDDAFAKELGSFEDLADLKKKMRENLQLDRAARERERQQSEMMAQLAGLAKVVTVPEVLVEKEIDRQLEEFNQMLAMQQKSIDDYLQGRGRSLDQVREEMREKALENVKTGLAMRALVQQENVEVTEEEIEEKVQDYLKHYASADDANDKIDVEALREQLTGMLRNQKAMEALEKKVTVKEESGEKKKADTDTVTDTKPEEKK